MTKKRNSTSPFQCYCGTYKRLKYRGIECDICGTKAQIAPFDTNAAVVIRWLETHPDMNLAQIKPLLTHHIKLVETVKW